MDFEPNNNAYNYTEEVNTGSKSMAIVSLVLGIIALVTGICFCTAIPFGIVSIILAIIVLVKNKNGKSYGIAGIVTSALGIISSIVVIIMLRPFYDGMQVVLEDLSENSEVIVEEYNEDGTIPQSVLDLFNGNEEYAQQFMEGIVSSYEENPQN